MECRLCGQAFVKIGRGRKYYCSSRCMKKAWALRNSDKVKAKQQKYNKTINRKISYLKYQHSEHGVARKKAYYLENREKIIAYNTARTKRLAKESAEFRKELNARGVARRIFFTKKPKLCEVCGATYFIHVHHIDRNPFNNTIENLMGMCRSCHGRAHRRPIPSLPDPTS